MRNHEWYERGSDRLGAGGENRVMFTKTKHLWVTNVSRHAKQNEFTILDIVGGLIRPETNTGLLVTGRSRLIHGQTHRLQRPQCAKPLRLNTQEGKFVDELNVAVFLNDFKEPRRDTHIILEWNTAGIDPWVFVVGFEVIICHRCGSWGRCQILHKTVDFICRELPLKEAEYYPVSKGSRIAGLIFQRAIGTTAR